MRSLILSLLALSCLLAGSAQAEDPLEARQIRLDDGRTVTALVVESTAEGMRVRVPQGLTLVPYSALAEISVIEKSQYDAQGPLRIAVAPSSPSTEARAAPVEGWLSDVAALVPHSTVVSTETWYAGLGTARDDLAACGADLGCLRRMSAGLDAQVLLVPQLVGTRLTILAAIPSTGDAIGIGTAQLTGIADSPSVDGAAALKAVFGSLSIDPEIDLAATVADAFGGVAEPVAVVEPEPTEPVVEPVVADPPTEDTTTDPPTEATATALEPRRARAFALGLLPVPGISSASLGDVPGFIIGLVTTVGLSGGAVYAIGRLARTPDVFWTPTILVPYGISILVNQISAGIGWGRLHGKRSGKAEASRVGIRPRVGASLAPLMGVDGRTPSGGAVIVLGTF